MLKPRTPLFNEATLLASGGGGSSASAADSASAPNPPPDDAGTAAAFDFRSALDDSGNFKKDWSANLPADVKDYADALGKYPNPTELVRGFVNAQKLIGKRQEVKPPAPDAKPEELAAWRKLVGAPETADGYKIAKPEKLPDGIEWNDANVKEFAEVAHKLNLSEAQAQALIQYDLERSSKLMGKGQEKIAEYRKSQQSALKETWGESYNDNLQKVAKLVELAGGDPNDPDIGDNAKVLELLGKLTPLLKEDGFVGSDKVGSGLTNTQQAEDIRRNPNNPWHAAFHGKEGKARQAEAQNVVMRLAYGVK